MRERELELRIARLEQELEEEKRKYDIIKDYANCALWEYEIADKRLVLSKKLEGKYSKTNMIIDHYQETMHGWNLVHPDDWDVFDRYCESMDRGEERFRYDVRQVTDESMFVWLRYEGETIYDANHRPLKVLGKTIDVTSEKRSTEELLHMAQRDAMTGLYNKETTGSLIQKFLHNPDSKNAGGALIIVDVDDFKSVNDTWGHLYGDFVLKQVANILTISSDTGDIVGRIGGDEFCIFCKGRGSEHELQEVAERILYKAANTQMKEAMELRLSIGIALFPRDACEYETLYHLADLALYATKQAGKNSYHFYQPGHSNQARRQAGRPARKEQEPPAAEQASLEPADAGQPVICHKQFMGTSYYMDQVLKGQKLAYYAVKPEDYSLVEVSGNMRHIFPKYTEGAVCYEAVMGKHHPCSDCPIKLLKGRERECTTEIYRSTVGRNYKVSLQLLSGLEGDSECLLSWQDISDQSEQLGVIDALTGALGYNRFRRCLADCLKNRKGNYAIVFVGIAEFEQFNEQYGIAKGSELLKSFASYMMRDLSTGELVCRLKGDDFFLLLDESREPMVERVNHLMVTFEALAAEQYRQWKLHTFAGIYHIGAGDVLIDEVCDRAKAAREAVRRGGKDEMKIREVWPKEDGSN